MPMRFTDYALIVLRRWWLIALLMLIAAGSAYVLSSRQPAVYRSTQLILIVPTRSDFGLTEASRLLLEPNVVYLDSSLRASAIIDDLALNMTPQQLTEAATIAADSQRMVIQVDVDTPDPDTSARIAEAWGQQLVEYRRQQNQRAAQSDRVEAVLPDVPSTRQVAPEPVFNAVAGAILGLILGLVLAFVLEFIESAVIRSRADLERGAGLVVLSSIPME